MKNITLHGTNFLVVSWSDMVELTDQLVVQVLESGEQFDRIIALANGGLTMVRLLCDGLNLHETAVIRTKYYTGVHETQSEPLMVLPLPVSVADERVLVCEDVVDSGATLAFVEKYLQKERVRSVDFVSQFVKPHTSVRPRWWGKEVAEWIIFPYEKRETRELLTANWTQAGLGSADIRTGLAQLELV